MAGAGQWLLVDDAAERHHLSEEAKWVESISRVRQLEYHAATL